MSSQEHIVVKSKFFGQKKVPIIKPQLWAELAGVETSGSFPCEYRPCQVELKDGRFLDRVYLIEAIAYTACWGVWPELDRGKRCISIDDVAGLRSSPQRLPPALANKIYAAGESGMGYCLFTVVLHDGRRLVYTTGNAVDFLEYPDGVSPDMIADVLPHEGRETLQAGNWKNGHKGAEYDFCLYCLPPETTAAYLKDSAKVLSNWGVSWEAAD